MEKSKQKVNYFLNFKKELDLVKLKQEKPTLVLHVCCAPCSSGCIEQLSEYFKVITLFYNPNISPLQEYEKRKEELIRFIAENPNLKDVTMIDCDYDNVVYKNAICGLENEPEGGKRCEKCFLVRLEKTAKVAKQINADYFTTTLTISPLKNEQLLNQIGISLEQKYDIKFLQSDFKKQDGYKKSIENSKKYNLYRQDYCGCIYSKLEREKQKEQKN